MSRTTVATALIAFLVTALPARAAPKSSAKPIDAGCPPHFVKQIWIVADKAPDCSSMKSIVETVTRGCETNDEKAVAIYNAGRFLWYHHQYPGEKGGIAALKLINVYGWSLCGGQHTVLAAMWRAAGWDWRYVGWRGHTTVECRYDGRWRYFDTFLKVYAWRADPNSPGGRTIASQADIKANPALISEQFALDEQRKVWYARDNRFEIINDRANWVAPAFFVCGDQPRGVVKGVQVTRPSGVSSKLGHAGIKFAEDGYNTNVNLAPGYSLELKWEHIDGAHWFRGRKYTPRHSCGDKEYRNCPAIGPILEPYRSLDKRGARTFSNGILRFAPDLGAAGCIKAFTALQNVKWSKGQLAPADPSKPASVTIRLQSPYIMSRAKAKVANIDKTEMSIDGGKTYSDVNLDDLDDKVGGAYACDLRLSFSKPVTSLDIEAIVQHNRCALPYLSPGANKITVSVADPKTLGENKLVVTYAYALGARSAPYEKLCDQGAELARAHHASWSDTPTVVRKVFGAGDLPATFEIPIPTPKDKHPVYPRMLFLRREVIAAGQEPQPIPKGALEAKVRPGQILKSLPNPFLMGLARPPKRVVRTHTTRKLPLKASHVVWRDKNGKMRDEVWRNHFVKTRPKSVEAWVMLVGGTLKDLPPTRAIAAGRLCIPVTNAITQAPSQLGAALLKAPFKTMKPYDLKNVGAVVGATVVPKYAKPTEPKYYKLDITRALKSLAAGEAKFHGLALTTVPNRGIDDGWTTSVTITDKKPMYIELDVYDK
ncbi:MAG: hypothetical protein QGG42_04335 [Phycisphaerae bacterium]|jgi:hypothetical protein|nr:hypothetical protein [Phycisphaerae bacterium]